MKRISIHSYINTTLQVKVRLQVQRAASTAASSITGGGGPPAMSDFGFNYRNMASGFRDLYKEGGLRSLYKGCVCMCSVSLVCVYVCTRGRTLVKGVGEEV